MLTLPGRGVGHRHNPMFYVMRTASEPSSGAFEACNTDVNGHYPMAWMWVPLPAPSTRWKGQGLMSRLLTLLHDWVQHTRVQTLGDELGGSSACC